MLIDFPRSDDQGSGSPLCPARAGPAAQGQIGGRYLSGTYRREGR